MAFLPQVSAAPAKEQAPDPMARRALWLLVAVNVFNYLDRQVLSAVIPSLRTEFFHDGQVAEHLHGPVAWLQQLLGAHSENAMLGLLGMAFMVVYMLGAPLAAVLPVRRWWLIGGGVILWSLASGASGLAATFGVLLLTRCFVGVGEAAYGPIAPAMIADMYPSGRGRAMSWFYLAVPIGSALGFIIGGGIAETVLGWRWAFYLVTLPGIALGVLCFFMREPRAATPVKAAEPTQPRSRWSDYRVLLRTPTYVFAVAGGTALTFAIGGIGFWMPSYVVEYRQEGTLSTVNATFGVILVATGITATMLGGILADRLAKRYQNAYMLVPTVSMMLAGPFFLLMMVTPFPLAWLWASLSCFCLFAATSPINTVLANVTPAPMRAAAFGLNILVIHALGDVISPVVIGSVADASDMQYAFYTVSGTVALGGLLWLWGCRYVSADTAAAVAASQS